MDFDVNWMWIGGSVATSIVLFYFKNQSDKRLQVYQKSEPLSSQWTPSSRSLVSIDLGTVDKTETLKSTNGIPVVALKQSKKEHKIVFNPTLRLWLDRPSVYSSMFTSVPFVLRSVDDKGNKLEVNVDCADESVFSSVLSPVFSFIEQAHKSSITANLLDFVSGEKTKAYETIEEGLKVGSRLTAIGYISEVKGNRFLAGKKLFIAGDESGKGFKLILSKLSVNELKVKEKSRGFYLRVGIALSASVAIGFLGYMIYHYLKEQLAKRRFERTLDQVRNQVRENGNVQQERVPLPDDAQNGVSEFEQNCVICLENQRETFFVPCGHVCTCFNCVSLLQNAPGGNRCPICRQNFTSVSTLRFP